MRADMFHSGYYQLCGIFEQGMSCLICLKMDICGVWIVICMYIKGIVATRICSCLKNCVKIGFVAENLTGLSFQQTR